MKKLSLYIFLGLMWCNVSFSNEIVNLVCSFEKNIENREMGDVVIGNKGDPDYSHYKERISTLAQAPSLHDAT